MHQPSQVHSVAAHARQDIAGQEAQQQSTVVHGINSGLKAAVHLKAELLAEGVALSPRVLEHYGLPYLVKRRAYGNPDPLELRQASIPQELYLGDKSVICAVNVRSASSWRLDFEGEYYLESVRNGWRVPVSFPLHPPYYDVPRTGASKAPGELVTLYGGGALGIFIYGDCALVQAKQACHYCSIEPNRKRATGFADVISPAEVEAAVYASMMADNGTIRQVMLNGGNFSDLNKSFSYYVRIAEAARRAVDRAGKDIPIHLIAFPPSNLDLINDLSDLGVEVAFNTEMYDEALFERYCPGKAEAGGHRLLWSALERAVKVLGKGRAFSIFVGGLEPLESCAKGLEFVAGLGATPVINVFHADPETPLASHPIATAAEIMAMGRSLQDVYRRFDVPCPFYEGCGRNSIDSEAYMNLF